MGIKTKNCEEYTPLREMFGRSLVLPAPLNDTDNVVAAAAPPAVGSAHTLAQTHLIPTTLLFNMASSTGSVTYRIVGYNQFGERVQEDLTLTGAAAIDDEATLHAYGIVTSITVTAKSGTPGNVIVGQDFNDAGVRLSVGLPFKGVAGDIAGFTHFQAAFSSSVTHSQAYHTLQLPAANPTVPTTVAVFLNRQSHLRF